MSSMHEEHSSTPGIPSHATRTTSPSTGQRKSPARGSSGSKSPVPASILPPTDLFPLEGLLKELLHQEAELWCRNELFMQSLRREKLCTVFGCSVSWVEKEWVCSVVGHANNMTVQNQCCLSSSFPITYHIALLASWDLHIDLCPLCKPFVWHILMLLLTIQCVSLLSSLALIDMHLWLSLFPVQLCLEAPVHLLSWRSLMLCQWGAFSMVPNNQMMGTLKLTRDCT